MYLGAKTDFVRPSHVDIIYPLLLFANKDLHSYKEEIKF